MLTMNDKKAIKLCVLSMVADKLIVEERNLADEVSHAWFSITDTGDIEDSRAYALGFLRDVIERLMDDVSDV